MWILYTVHYFDTRAGSGRGRWAMTKSERGWIRRKMTIGERVRWRATCCLIYQLLNTRGVVCAWSSKCQVLWSRRRWYPTAATVPEPHTALWFRWRSPTHCIHRHTSLIVCFTIWCRHIGVTLVWNVTNVRVTYNTQYSITCIPLAQGYEAQLAWKCLFTPTFQF